MTIKNFIKQGIIIIVGTLIGSVANYVYNMLNGRLLGPELYGSYTSLVSVLAIVSVPSTAIQTIAAKASSTYLADDQWGKVKTLNFSLHRRLWPIGLAIMLMGIIFSSPIASFLNIESPIPVIIIALAFFFVFMIPITRGIIQGTQQFFQLSVNSSLEAIFRLGLGLGLILAGLSLNGAISGVILGISIAYFLSFFPIKKIFNHQGEKIDKRNLVNYSIPTVIVILCITTLVNVDIILAKHYLSPHEASYYAALSTIAKIIFYFSGPIVSVMFPMISNLHTKGEKHFHLLLTTFFAVLLASLAILVIFMIAPQFTINLLYGKEFIAIWPYLASMGLVMLIYGLINVMSNYFLSIGQMNFMPYLVVMTLLQIVALSLYHQSISQFVLILLVTQSLLLGILILLYFISKWPLIVSKLKD